MTEDLEIQAEIIATNSTAALTFGDGKAIEEMLAALKAKQNIVAACVYNKNGQPFARYLRKGSTDLSAPMPPPGNSSEFRANDLIVFHRIVWDGEMIGTVFIQSDLNELQARLQRLASIVAVVLAGALGIALLMAARSAPGDFRTNRSSGSNDTAGFCGAQLLDSRRETGTGRNR